MKIKEVFAGIFILYGVILLASFFNLPIVFFIPISIAGFEVGKVVTSLILFLISFFFLKSKI